MNYVRRLLWRMQIGGACNLAVHSMRETRKRLRRKNDPRDFQQLLNQQEQMFVTYLRLHYKLSADSPKLEEARQLLRKRAEEIHGMNLWMLFVPERRGTERYL